ncbi:MAG: FAD:protein FMN transferase [Salegentibacter sp.]
MKKLVFALFLAALLTGCNNSEVQPNILTGEALGTTFHIKYFPDKEIDADQALDSIFENINNSMSTYREGSDISRLNKGDTSVVIDRNFEKVFNFSKKIYRESNGYFDPTVGILVNAYGFGPEEEAPVAPDSITLDSLRRYVGFNKLRVSEDHKIMKDDPHVYLDFNAIAKGYTIDVIAAYFDSKNVKNYLIELGGELVAKGRNIGKDKPWMVAIDDPLQKEDERSFQTILALKNRALATSGNYRKFRVDSTTGKRYVHTINPLTGKAQRSNLLSASVMAENCALADGYATACMALGLEKSKEMLKKLKNVEVYLIYSDDSEQNISVYASEGFKNALQE